MSSAFERESPKPGSTMSDPSSAGLKELLNRRFVALLVVSFLASFVSAPLYSSLVRLSSHFKNTHDNVHAERHNKENEQHPGDRLQGLDNRAIDLEHPAFGS